MDPLATASAFASIVGLVGLFKSERHATESATIDQYIDWLRRCEHRQIADLIQRNNGLSKALQDLFSHGHDEVMSKLHELDRVLIDVASRLQDFNAVAAALPADSQLSVQAIDILKQFNAAKASRVAELKMIGRTQFQFWDGNRGNMAITDERFLEDDLLILCERGLLRSDYSSKGTRFFIITRAGAAVGG